MPIQIPSDTDRTPGTVSVRTRRPPGSSVRRAPPRQPPGAEAAAPALGVMTFVMPGDRSSNGSIRRDLDRDGRSGGGGIGARAVGRRLVDDRDQADLAAVVDVGDLDTELVADLHDVLDLADALA